MAAKPKTAEPTSRSTFDPPDLAHAVAPRRSVVDLLDRSTGSVAVVEAPGGYGKTSQVAAWARLQSRPVAWVDLERCDDDPDVLFERLVGALDQVTDFDRSSLRTDRSSGRPLPDAVGRAVRRCSIPFVIVLDDVHLVSSQPSLDLLDEVIRHIPPRSTIVLVGRTRPTLALSRLDVDDEIVEIGPSNLALGASETRFILASMGVELDDDRFARVVDVTEGWPVGVRLVGRVLRSASDGDGLGEVDRATFGGDRAIARYFREEWLCDMSTADVEFLTRVSGLDELSADVCDHVLDRSDSGAVLERLHEGTSVLIPLDRLGIAYRLHHLLREVLAAKFLRTDRRGRLEVERRSSEWFEQVGDIDRALRHALCADDMPRMERLIREFAPGRHTVGRFADVDRWIELLPKPYVLASPGLCLLGATTAFGNGDGDSVVLWLRFARQALSAAPSSEEHTLLDLQLAAFDALMSRGEPAAARAEAERARRGLTSGVWHAVACNAQGGLSLLLGDLNSAEEALAEGAAEAHIVGATTLEAACRALLAVVYWERDDSARALASARSVRRVMSDHGLDGMPTLFMVNAVHSLAAAINGDADLARADLALTRLKLSGYRRVCGWGNVLARIVLTRTCLRLGDRVGARTFSDELAAFVNDDPDMAMAQSQIATLERQLQAAQRAMPAGPTSLTSAELRVLQFLPTNLTHEEIGHRLYVSRNTAKSHAAAVYRKLGASSRTEAVEIARAAGLLSEERGIGAVP